MNHLVKLIEKYLAADTYYLEEGDNYILIVLYPKIHFVEGRAIEGVISILKNVYDNVDWFVGNMLVIIGHNGDELNEEIKEKYYEIVKKLI